MPSKQPQTQAQGDIFDQVAANPPTASSGGDIFDQVAANPPTQATPPPPTGTISAIPSPGFFERARRVVANSAIGHSVEQELPSVADWLNLHPTETVNSPDYQAHQQQLIAPEYLAPNAPTSAAGNIGKGALRAVGQITSAPSLATMTGIAATGGLAAPLALGTGAAATAGRIGTQAVKIGMGAQGLYGVGSGLNAARKQYQAGDKAGAEQSLGETLPNAAMMIPAAGEAAQTVGERMQGGGVDMMNRSVLGVRKSDLKRGANPGEAYFTAGNGPSLSMRSIANKASNSLDATGENIGNAIASGTGAGVQIPGEAVNQAVQGPATAARSTLNGAFGAGSGALDQRMQTFNGKINPTMTPQQVFNLKQQVSKNVNWSDPTAIGLKQVGQQITGGLSGVLSEHVPELAPLNRQYQGLTSLQNLADQRAATGQRSLTGIAAKTGMGIAGSALGMSTLGPKGAILGLGATALDSIPVKSTLASGLYYGGKGLANVGGAVSRGTNILNFKPTTVTPVVDGLRGTLPPRQLPASVPINEGFGDDSIYAGSTSGVPVTPARPSIITPPPIARPALPASTMPGTPQPMIGVKPSLYPPLAEDYARTRVVPTKFNGPPANPLGQPRAFLNAANPPRQRGRKGS